MSELSDDTGRFPEPGPEAGVPRANRLQPRNFLERSDRRWLMWRVMPVAAIVLLGLSIAERAWFGRRLPEPAPDIDTALEAVRGPDPTGDAVRLEPLAEEPDPLAIDPSGLAAPPAALAQVRDDTFFREGDIDAWLQTWLTLRQLGATGLEKAPAPRVSFAELFGQPRSFRGRLVRFKGTLKRVERLQAPANNYGIEDYWQGWLEPASGPAAPIVLQFLDLPAGMPVGMKIHESVGVTGYFFKRYAYNAADTIRVAPLVMALEPRWMPLVAPGGGSGSLPAWTLAASIAAVVAAVVAGGWALRNSGRRQAARGHSGPDGSTPGEGTPIDSTPIDIAAALAGFEPVTPEESLRRLAATGSVSSSATSIQSDPPGAGPQWSEDI